MPAITTQRAYVTSSGETQEQGELYQHVALYKETGPDYRDRNEGTPRALGSWVC